MGGPDCILLVVLKKFKPELAYIQAEICNICLKESYFPDFLEGLIGGTLYLRMFGKDARLKTTAQLVFFA